MAYFDEVRRNKAQVNRRLSDAERLLTAAYHQARRDLAPTLSIFTDRYTKALNRARGQDGDGARVPVMWLYDSNGGHWPFVASRVTDQLRTFGRTAYDATYAAKADAGALGVDGAQHAIQASLQPIIHKMPTGWSVRKPNASAVAAFIERSKAGTPLSALFDSFGPDEADALRDTITAGLMAGSAPLQLAREVSATIDQLTYGRAVTICRTEVIHAWHAASIASYQANRDVVDQWMWVADKSANSCAACIAMDGTLHSLDEELDDHVNGRCAKAPVTRSYDDILFSFGVTSDGDFGPGPTDGYQSGADWLAQQSPATQRAVFGSDAAYQAYAQGDADLADFAAVRHSTDWGASIQQASLRSMGLKASDYQV